MTRWVIAACLLFTFSSVLRAEAPPAAADRPNVVYILADDLGYADIGVQGKVKDVKTPNVDAIAAAGVRFTNGYVSCPVCSPTRAGLMTGRYQQRFGHEVNPGPDASPDFGLPTDQITLAQTVKAAGYATGAVGKWHLGFKPEMLPTSRGFDSFYGFLGGAHGYNVTGPGNNALMRNDQHTEWTEYLTDAFAKEAVAFIDKHASAREKGGADAKPFFLYLAFNAVHVPQEAPAKYMDRFPDEKDTKRRNMLAMLSAMDDAVGQVMAALEKHGQTQNTLVIFHSDNGGPTPGNGSRNDPLRGFKGTVWEGGVRIPFMMQWKGKLPAGKVYDKPIISLDMFPTICAVTGATPPKNVKLDGVDIMPFIKGEGSSAAAAAPHETLFWRYSLPKWAVRDGDFKLVHEDAKASVQLFDLSKDMGEQTDVASQHPDVVKRLQAKFDEWSSQLENPRWHDARMERKDAKAAGEDVSGGGGKGKKGGKKRQAAEGKDENE